jgi:4-amino-4-deoxy-L-arabinose transferase-like glycosyltransferase
MSTLTIRRPLRAGPVDETKTKRRAHAGIRRLPLTAVGTATGFAVVAAVLRLVNITTSYDLFIDEATYAAIARDTTLATGPMLHGLPFVLHPPLALLLLAGQEQVLGTQDVAALVVGMRPFVALIGALTVAVLYLALHRAGLPRAAFVAAALVALDPFIISFDSRVMLEAFAQLFAVLTIAAAIRALTAGPRTRWRWYSLTAVAGAATFGTKETFGLVVLATLLLVALTSQRGHRRPFVLVVGGTLAGYALINFAMINWAGFQLWWHMRTDGLSRLLGTQQSTGFKAEGVEGSFWDRLMPNGVELGATYAILAAGGVCALSLLWDALRGRTSASAVPPVALAAARIVAIWAVCACGYVAYAVVFGSLEEQMFYIAAAPCAAALATRLFLPRRRVPAERARHRAESRRPGRAALAGVAAILLLQSTAWVVVHTTPDDVYAQLLDEVSAVAPAGSTMAVTEETGQFVLTGYDLGQWATVPELQSNDVEYVLMSERLVEHGYGLADREFADAVRQHGSLVLSVQGRRGDLQLYDVSDWTGAAASVAATQGDGS